jgi:hypothetical protein
MLMYLYGQKKYTNFALFNWFTFELITNKYKQTI